MRMMPTHWRRMPPTRRMTPLTGRRTRTRWRMALPPGRRTLKRWRRTEPGKVGDNKADGMGWAATRRRTGPAMMRRTGWATMNKRKLLGG